MAKLGLVSLAESDFLGGKFAVALRRLRSLTNPSPEQGVLLAECLEMCGVWNEAADRASALSQARYPAAIQGRARTILGSICSINSDLDTAEKHFLEARKKLKHAGAHERACESAIRRLTSLLNMRTGSFLENLAAELQTETARFSNPRLSSMFHVAAGNLHASVRRFDLARTHVALAHSFLRTNPNAWLAASLALAESGIAYMEGDSDSALEKALEANRYAEESGQLWSRAASATTCAFLLIRSGKATDAARWISAAGELTEAIPVLRIANLENVAESALFAADKASAQRVLEQLESPSTVRAIEGSWYQTPIMHTCIRLHRLVGDPTGAESLSSHGIALAESRGDHNSVTLFSACRAEALAILHRKDEALTIMHQCVPALPSGAVSAHAEIDRALAELFAALGQEKMGAQCLAHAVRLAESVGDAVLAAETKNALSKFGDMEVTATSHSAHVSALQFWHLVTSGSYPHVLRWLLASDHYHEVFKEVSLKPLDEEELSHPGCEVLPLDSRTNTGQVLQLVAASGELPTLTSVLLRACLDYLRPVTRRDKLGNTRPRPILGSLDERPSDIVIGSSMLQLLETANRIANTSITVLITGETGTGKEVIARFIHKASDRRTLPFVAVNCSALPRELLESTLFGHRRGAFTGASESFDGLVKGAEGGTLFLDEVGDLPLDLQPKFLRFLETGEVLPLGTNQPTKVNVRVLAATNANLSDLVEHGRFRADLYYRLNGIHFELPPLRSRRTEIPALARHLLERYAEEFGKGNLTLSPEAMEHLLLYDWPGNVRQLASELRRVAALADANSAIDAVLLSDRILDVPPRDAPPVEGERTLAVPIDQNLERAIETVERAMIARALERTRGRVDDAARLLGISRKGLFLKRRRYGIATRES